MNHTETRENEDLLVDLGARAPVALLDGPDELLTPALDAVEVVHSDADAESDGDANRHPDKHTHEYADEHPDGYTDEHSDRNSHGHADRDAHRNPDGHGDAHGHPDIRRKQAGALHDRAGLCRSANRRSDG